MSQLNELEYSALATQTGVSGITLNEQRVKFYDSQTGRNGSNPLQAEISYLQLQTSLTTSNVETLWRTFLLQQGITQQSSLNDMKRYFWINATYSPIQTYVKALSGLVAYYPLDETSGNAINQAPATLGTLDGTVSGATQGVAGQSGLAYSFDGVNDQISRTLISSDVTDVSTFILFKSDDYTKNRQPLWSHGSSTNGYALVLSGDATTDGSLYVLNHAVAWQDTAYNVQDNNWHIIVFNRNAAANNVQILLDGVQIYSANPSLGVPATTTSIGSENIGFFKGKLQHWGFVQQVLTTAQALKLAQLAGLA